MGSEAAVILTTAPTIIWLFVRFFFILRKHYRPILFHLKHSVPSITSFSGKKSRFWGSIVSFAIHVILGIGSLCLAPHLAYLLLPPNHIDHEKSTTVDVLLPLGYRHYFSLIAAVMVVINGSVFWMIPHPKRYEEYNCERQRQLISAWTRLAAPAMSFICMAVNPLAFLIPIIRVPTAVLSIILYAWVVAICLFDACDVPWEKQMWGVFTLKFARFGPSGKSKLTQIYFENDKGKEVVLISFAIPAALCVIVNCAMLRTWLITKKDVPIGQEVFFILTSLYQTAVMSAGFFTQAQASDQRQQDNTKLLLTDVALTQILPLFVMVVGPQWAGYESFSEFNWNFFLWTS